MKKRIQERSIIKVFIFAVLLVFAFQGWAWLEEYMHMTPSLDDGYVLQFNTFALARMAVMALLGWIALLYINFCGVLNVGELSSGFTLPIMTKNRKIFWLIIFVINAVFAYLAIFQPKIFFMIADEDGPVETLSALLCFFAAGMFFIKGWIILKGRHHKKKLYTFCMFLLGLVLFVVGMEEISWMQRVFDFKTPYMMLIVNDQGEINLHNISPKIFYTIYYLGEFVLLILLPYIVQQLALDKKWEVISDFTPSRFVMFVASLALVYNCDLWNYWIIQWMYFFTLFIFIQYGCVEKRTEDLHFIRIFIIYYLVLQALFALFVRHELSLILFSEYKELFIPLAFIVYAWEIFFTRPELNIRKSGFSG